MPAMVKVAVVASSLVLTSRQARPPSVSLIKRSTPWVAPSAVSARRVRRSGISSMATASFPTRMTLPHAAVSESVDTAPTRSRGFVNALLRTYLRGGCRYTLPEGDPLTRMSVEYSAPVELCAFWCERYGEDLTSHLLSSTTRNPSVTLRVNPLTTSVESVVAEFTEEEASLCSLAPDMVTVKSAAHITDGIRAGKYFVQDPASRLCVKALDPQPGETVIDTCAAPGG